MRQVITQDLGLSWLQLPGYSKKAKNLIKNDMKKAKAFADIVSLIKELSKNYNIGILTSNSQENVQHLLDKEKIKNINFIFSDSSIFGKHVVIKRLLNKYDLHPEEIIYIGDEARMHPSTSSG